MTIDVTAHFRKGSPSSEATVLTHERAIACVVIAVMTLSSGCSQRQSANRPSIGPTSYDAGGIVVDKTSRISHTFGLKNTSNRQLNILDVQNMCGCLESTVAPRSLAPYQEATVQLSAHITPSYSSRTAACTIKTDDPHNGAITYSLSFQTFPRVQFRPLALNLGQLGRISTSSAGRDSSADAWLEVLHSTGEAIDSPARFEMPDGVRVEVRGQSSTDEPARNVVRTNYPIHIRIREDRLARREQLAIKVVTQRGESASLPVLWTLRNPIEAVPNRLHLGTLTALTSNSVKILVRSTEDRAFRILSITGDEAGTVSLLGRKEIGADSPARKAHSISLEVHIRNAAARAAAGTITVATDDRYCPRLPIYWSAFVEGDRVATAHVDR